MMVGGLALVVIGAGILGCRQKNNGAVDQSGSSSSSSGTGMFESSKVSWSGSQQEEFPDPKYGMVAATVDIPEGWKFAGSIVRTEGCHASQGPNFVFTSQAQDGITGSVGLPGVTWGWSSNPAVLKRMAEQDHCPGVDITTADKFLTNIVVPNLHPHAKIVAVLPLPSDQQAAMEKKHEDDLERNAQRPKQFQSMNSTVDGGRVRVQYDRNGRAVEEMISVQVSCFESATPPQRHCSTMATNIVRAPQGHLDEALAALQEPHVKELAASFKINPAWMDKLNADNMAVFHAGMARNNAQFQQMLANGRAQNDALLARGRAFNAQQQSRFESAMANDRAKQAAIDASAHNTVNYSLDRQDYVNPATGQTVTTDSGYNHQWMSSDGSTVIQTQSHSYDPNGQVYPGSQSWTELVPK
jgi:hypothetical protein